MSVPYSEENIGFGSNFCVGLLEFFLFSSSWFCFFIENNQGFFRFDPKTQKNSRKKTKNLEKTKKHENKYEENLKLLVFWFSQGFWLFVVFLELFFPEALRRVLLLKAAANFTCQLLMPTCRELLHLPTSHANLSRVTSPANFSCQLVESYFTCQLLMPTCRELLHLLTSHANLSRVTSPAYFSCQLFGCYLILLKAQANLSGVTSLS